MYKPLPDYLTIKESKIHGLGVYATDNIEKGTHIGITHYRVPTIPEVIRSPLGGFINHSDSPNCERYWEFDQDFETNWSRLVAVKDIKKGEEITLEYSMYKI